MSAPRALSRLAQPITSNNFVAVQSAKLAVTTTSASLTFTLVPGTLRVTAKITNSGTTGCYVASGNGSATAILSTSTPSPAAGGTDVVSNCDYVAAGAILTQDYIAGTNTWAAICAASTSTLEISVGYGQ